MVRLALLLLIGHLTVCLCAVGEYTEEQLYHSSEWRDEPAQPLILTRTRAVPAGFLKALLAATEKSSTTIFKVTCEEAAADGDEAEYGEVCKVLNDYKVAVRVGGAVNGVSVPSQGYDSELAFVVVVLEHLLASSISQLTSYDDLVKFTSDHPKHLLVLTPDTSSEEYAALLVAVLTWPLPLAVAMMVNVLPLSRRPYFSRHSPPLRLWCVEQYDSSQLWYQFQDISFLQQNLNSEAPPTQLVMEFVERFKYPIIVQYDTDELLESTFLGSGLHLAVVFPGLSGASDIEPVPLVMGVAQKAFLNYAFVLADRSRDSDYSLRLYVTDQKPLPHLVLLPYGREVNFIGIDVDGQDLASETQRVTNIMESILMEHPKGGSGQDDYSEMGPSMTDISVLRQMVKENKYSILGYFCQRDADNCMSKAYSVVRDVLTVVRRTELGRSLAAHVVQCHSEKDVKKFNLERLPGCAVYNHTSLQWSAMSEDITSNSDVLRFLGDITGVSGLEDMADAMINHPPPLSFAPPPPPPLQEEDQINLVVRALQHPKLPSEIILTSANFGEHISKFLKSVVVFCVKWSVRCKVFSHHIMTAHSLIDKALNTSLATVSCDDFTELCAQYHITAYPTVLLFTPSSLDSPTPLTGILDSAHLLAALGHPSDEARDVLGELTPASLPSLLRGSGLEKTLLLWCARDLASNTAKVFLKEKSKGIHTKFLFAWINSTRHSTLLSTILPDTTMFPSVVAVNLKQHSVFHLPVGEPELFERDFSTFLTALNQQTLEPSGRLGDRSWPPLQPPVPFPSQDYDEEEHHDDQYYEDGLFNDEDFHYEDYDQLHHQEPPMDNSRQHPHTPPSVHHHKHTEL